MAIFEKTTREVHKNSGINYSNRTREVKIIPMNIFL